MLRILVLGLLHAVLTTSSATKITSPNGEIIEISDSDFFELSQSPHRKGFEVFYQASNFFIDNIFSFPDIQNATFQDQFKDQFKNKDLDQFVGSIKNNVGSIISIPHEFYPSLYYFTIFSFVLACLLPIIGMIYCSYRCCCKSSKGSQVDRRADSCKRKFYTVYLFIVLILILIGAIVLFFTNQNSDQSIKEVPKVFGNIKSDLIEFNQNEMPTFYESVIQNFKLERNDTSDLIRNVSVIFMDKYSSVLNDSLLITKLKSEVQKLIDLAVKVDQKIADKLKKEFNIDSALNETVSAMENVFGQIDLDKIESGFSDTISSKVDIIRNLTEKYVKQLDGIIGINGTQVDMFGAAVKKIDKVIWLSAQYYQYFYYTLLAVCVFVLFLFFLYSTGLVGILARRTSSFKSQCCHRTIHSRLIMSGVGFFFLFSWILMILAITLYIPGIAMRHMVCKPAIEIENNQFAKSMVPEFEAKYDFNYTVILRECNSFNHSVELTNIVDQKLEQLISNTGFASKFFEFDIESELNQFINKTVSKLKEEETKTEVQSQPDLKAQIEKLIALLQTSDDDKSPEFSALVEKLETIKNETQEIASKLVISQIISQRVGTVMNDISCSILPTIYKQVINTACFNYLDNFNAYWVFLIVVVLLNIPVAFFGAKQADLFRKSYPYGYDMNFAGTKHIGRYESSDYEVFQSRSPSEENMLKKGQVAIDAFEMDDKHYSNNKSGGGQNTRAANGSPPPKYHF